MKQSKHIKLSVIGVLLVGIYAIAILYGNTLICAKVTCDHMSSPLVTALGWPWIFSSKSLFSQYVYGLRYILNFILLYCFGIAVEKLFLRAKKKI